MELLAQFELGSERTIIVDGDHDHSTLWSEADHSGFGAEIHEDPQHIDPRTIPAVPGRGRREEIGLERNRDEATVGTDDHGPLFEHHQVVQAFTLWQWMVRGATLLHIEDAHPELRPDKDPPSHRVEGAHVVMEDTHLLSNRGVETQRQIDDVSLGAPRVTVLNPLRTVFPPSRWIRYSSKETNASPAAIATSDLDTSGEITPLRSRSQPSGSTSRSASLLFSGSRPKCTSQPSVIPSP